MSFLGLPDFTNPYSYDNRRLDAYMAVIAAYFAWNAEPTRNVKAATWLMIRNARNYKAKWYDRYIGTASDHWIRRLYDSTVGKEINRDDEMAHRLELGRAADVIEAVIRRNVNFVTNAISKDQLGLEVAIFFATDEYVSPEYRKVVSSMRLKQLQAVVEEIATRL